MDYVNGLKMYEAIVEQKILETAQNQITKLENISEQLVVEDKIPEPAEVQEIKAKAEEKIAEEKEKVEKQVEEIKNAEEVVDKDPSAVLKENDEIPKKENSNVEENIEDKKKDEVQIPVQNNSS
jgi:alanyl-tRNA synthetase